MKMSSIMARSSRSKGCVLCDAGVRRITLPARVALPIEIVQPDGSKVDAFWHVSPATAKRIQEIADEISKDQKE